MVVAAATGVTMTMEATMVVAAATGVTMTMEASMSAQGQAGTTAVPARVGASIAVSATTSRGSAPSQGRRSCCLLTDVDDESMLL
jgi:hypothetical protein